MLTKLNNKYNQIICASLIILALVGGLLMGRNTPLQAKPLQNLALLHQISNAKDGVATISWLTLQNSTGQVQCGTDPNNLNLIFNDERGSSITAELHHVNLTGLNPTSLYYCDIIVDGVIDDNNGNHYTFSTGPTLSPPPPDTIYGQVFQDDGVTPAAGCVVYINLLNADGQGSTGRSTVASALTDSNGYWGLNRASLRELDLNSLFAYSNSGDQMEIIAQCGSQGQSTQTVDTSVASPLPPLISGILAVNEINISGPSTIQNNQVLTLSASISPTLATLPITYTWIPTPTNGQNTAQAIYTNLTTGTHTISVSVENAAGSVSNSHQVSVGEAINGIAFSIPQTITGTIGSQANIPINIGNVSNQGIIAFYANISFNPTVLRPLGTSTQNTLAEMANCTITSNTSLANQITFNGVCDQALSGAGTLLNLSVAVTNTANLHTDLIINDAIFNEGLPAIAIEHGHFSSVGLSIIGNISHGPSGPFNPVPVLSTTVSLWNNSLSTTLQTTTPLSNGIYTLTAPNYNEGYHVLVSKTGDERTAISSYDSALIAQAEVGLITLSPWQQQVCDVSGNGTCTSYDAAIIANYIVGNSIPADATVGNWIFEPASRYYPQLTQSLSNQNYQAYLMGDVSGNWADDATQAKTQNNSNAIATYQLSIPTLTATANSEIKIPLMLNNTSSSDISLDNIIAYQIKLQIDPSIAEFTGISQADTLSANWAVVENNGHIAAYHTEPLTNEGILLYVNLKLIGQPTEQTALSASYVRLNEGTPPIQAITAEINHQVLLPIVFK